MKDLIKRLKTEGYTISTDPDKLQIEVIHGYLTRAYWSEGIPIEKVKSAIENSFGFGV